MKLKCSMCDKDFEVMLYHYYPDGQIIQGIFNKQMIKDGKYKNINYRLCPGCCEMIEKFILITKHQLSAVKNHLKG